MLTERAISVTGIILGSSLVAVAIAGEVTDCQTSVTRKDCDLAHWSWRTIDGRQCWYRGARWKPKHELRWTDATPSVAGQPEMDNSADGLGAAPKFCSVAPRWSRGIFHRSPRAQGWLSRATGSSYPRHDHF